MDKIDFYNLKSDNEIIFSNLSRGETVGVFQLSTKLSTKLCKDLKINNFNDMIAAMALSRPGTLHSGMTEDYIKRKHGEKWDRKHELYEKITEDTYGVLIYQEQVMQVFHSVAGLSYSVADNIRKIIGKKKDVSEFDQYYDMFLEGCIKNKTFSKKEVKWFWNMLLECSNYLFNKSHAVEYATISYWTAYAKHFYPAEFICASLTHGSEKNKIELIEEAKRLGLEIIPPKIGMSDAIYWKVNKGKLYIPFIEIKGIGEKTANKIAHKEIVVRKGFFDLFGENKKQMKVNAKTNKILNEIKAYSDEVPKNINKYLSFDICKKGKEDITVEKIEEVMFYKKSELLKCKACNLYKECDKQVYPSKGKYNVMIVGEAPGRDEDKEGRSFVGKAGRIVWEEIEKYGLERSMFHVSNVCKCFPSKTKTPSEYAIKTCMNKWLKTEIEKLECQFILAFGNTGLKAFSDRNTGITSMNGKIEWSSKVNAFICYVIHPASVLRGGTERSIFNKGMKKFTNKVKEIKNG